MGSFFSGHPVEDSDIDWKILDSAADSSIYWIFEFNLLPAENPRVIRTISELGRKTQDSWKWGWQDMETTPTTGKQTWSQATPGSYAL